MLTKTAFGPLDALTDQIDPQLLPPCDGVALRAHPAHYCAQIVDQVLAAAPGRDQVMISLGGQAAMRAKLPDPFLPDPSWLADPQLEALGAMGTIPAVRGMGLAGLISGWADGVLADGVVCFAKDAVTATQNAQQIGLAIVVGADRLTERPMTDNLGHQHQVPAIDGHLDPDQTWDALAPAARLATQLRQDGVIKGAAIAVRGRGRLIGNVQPSALLRFRASDWR